MWSTNSLEKTLMLGKVEAAGEVGDRGWDVWMASLTQQTWVWGNSGRQYRTGSPGMLQSMGFAESDMTKWLNSNKIYGKSISSEWFKRFSSSRRSSHPASFHLALWHTLRVCSWQPVEKWLNTLESRLSPAWNGNEEAEGQQFPSKKHKEQFHKTFHSYTVGQNLVNHQHYQNILISPKRTTARIKSFPVLPSPNSCWPLI